MTVYTVTETAALHGPGRNDKASKAYDTAADAYAAFRHAVDAACDSAVYLTKRDGQWSQTLATAEVHAALKWELNEGDDA